MLQLLKYLPKIILGFKDVSDQYKAETGEGRPWYLSRTFIYSALCFASTVATMALGIEFDAVKLQTLADNLPTLIGAIIAIVGAVGSFVAQWKSKQKKATGDGSQV